MKDKLVLVTGPTSGIGKEIAAQLAAMGAQVVLGCRDESTGNAARSEIATRTGSDRLSVVTGDLSSQSSIRDLARRFKADHGRLDVLVNNAGINRRKQHKSVDGIDLVFATNVLGYHLLTRELLDLIKATPEARIVNVASTFASNLDLDDLEFERRPYDPTKAYAQSKACDRLLTWAWARRLEGSGVTINAMAPGLVQTGLYRDVPAAVRFMLRIVGLFHGRSVEQGANTAVWLASSPEVKGLNARFFELRKEVPCQFRNRDDEEKLWGICERLVG
jgi:NAD(P)-dependent dehydrogenase (short-subunit alcohol dehydrogenase family)